MSIKFIHTADWQIGRRFAAFDDEMAVMLRAARVSVIERIADVARKQGAEHVLVAGDVFEDENSDPRVYQKPIAKLKAYKDLTWHLLPGNHDVARSAIWPSLVKEGLPKNVSIYLEPGVHEIADGVHLLVSPVQSRTSVDDPTAWMDEAGAGEGDICIGLAHGSVQNFGTEASILISGERAQKAGLDYLALGDWHGVKKVNERTWYAGTPETDGWKDNDPGHVLAIEIAHKGAVPKVERIKVGQFVWHEFELELSKGIDLSNLCDELGRLASQPDNLLLKFRLSGVISPSDYASLDAELNRLAAIYGSLIRNEKKLEIRVIASDLETLKSDPTLHLAATRLKEMADAGPDGERQTAQSALRQLFTYAARLEKETGA